MREGACRGLRVALITVGFALAVAVVAPAQSGPPDSGFQASETHTATQIADGPRKDWTEHVDSVRFGSYSLTVTQRIDPQTGLPQQGNTQWGDAFVGVGGKKPAVYMASNWSPWFFLSAEIKLDGDEGNVPEPTMKGKLVYSGLREATGTRAVGDFVWEDAAGGLLRARCVGWRGVDWFGLSLRYFPPEGRTVAALSYVLTCQPYDYSDRGYWERKRWLSTTVRDEALADKTPLQIDLEREQQLVFHNRFAQITSGTVLALEPRELAEASAVAEGNYVKTKLTPRPEADELHLLLGDWVDRNYALVRDEFIGRQTRDCQERLGALRDVRLAPPVSGSEDEDAGIASLLAAHPALEKAWGDKVRACQENLEALVAQAESLAPGDSHASVAALVELQAAAQAREEFYQQIRGDWLARKAWLASG